MDRRPFIIAFAGAVGSSKTPIATYLSYHLQLPIFNQDAIRSEVTEDFLHFDEAEYSRRRDERLDRLLESKTSFIADASIDRAWSKIQPRIVELGFDLFVISLDFSPEFLEKLYRAKKYDDSLQRLEKLVADRQLFLAEHQSDISLHITEREFPQRLALSLAAVQEWLKK